jgi:anti-anti-sigma factor
MKSERESEPGQNGKAKRTRVAKPQAVLEQHSALIDAERSGDWMPAEELWEAAQAAVSQGKDVTLNLDKIDHLDASALQILLALDAEQKKKGLHLQLAKASSNLRDWFDYSGAAALFPMTEQRSND